MRRDSFLDSRNDDWYIRFPDGKVLHATSTGAVRGHIDDGRIPLESTVRRRADEEWTTLAWTAEFADLVAGSRSEAKRPSPAPRRRKSRSLRHGKATTASSRLDPRKMGTVAVRSLVPELLAALENTVMRGKLAVIAVTGLLLGGLFALMGYPLPELGEQRWCYDAALCVLATLALAAAATLLTRATFAELSHMRPALPDEVRPRWAGRTLQLWLAQMLVGGSAATACLLLRALPDWLLHTTGAAGAPLAAVVGAVLEVALWPVAGLTLLLAPLVVIERLSVPAALLQGWRLFRQQPGNVLLHELLALAVGLMVALTAGLPLFLLPHFDDSQLTLAAATTRAVLSGLPAAFLFAYLTVANVFIYLNLRYETPPVEETA